MSRQKESDAAPNSVNKTCLLENFKKLDNNTNAADVGNNQSMFVLKILEKNQWNTTKISSRKCNRLNKDSKL